MSATVNEFAKMRRLRVGAIAAVLVVCVIGLSSPAFADPAERSWDVPLAGMALAVPLVSPVLIAALASRQVDIEHHGNGWFLSETTGVPPGRLCRIKLVALGTVVATVTLIQCVGVALVGGVAGFVGPFPLGRFLGFTLAVLTVNLVLLALHLLLAAWSDNQLIGLGLGVLGGLVAVFSDGLPTALAHVTPWGYYTLSAAADYRDGELVALTPAYASVAALGVVGAVVFAYATALFDRRKA